MFKTRGGVKGRLNIVKKNCTFTNVRFPYIAYGLSSQPSRFWNLSPFPNNIKNDRWVLWG